MAGGLLEEWNDCAIEAYVSGAVPFVIRSLYILWRW